ncbi:MAG: class I SAM-dependent methyltransferase [Clostridia bacterium]|nr:class I SAM-dependent methyltransferase [Clostridia bacterium]
MNELENYYLTHDEDGRLLSKHGSVEFITTMKYIGEYLAGVPSPSVLEVGAGTGRYSVTLAKEGLSVTAVELFEHNLGILKSKLDGSEPIRVIEGNALDLSMLDTGSFDLTLLLGPMYHLYTREEKLRALSEAVRVTKKGGIIMVAYCMNDPVIIQYVFAAGHLEEVLAGNMLTRDWHTISRERDLFEMVRPEEIASLDDGMPVERLKLVATDGASHYMSGIVDGMDDTTFGKWIEYHLAVCEREDLIGASNHTLDILRKL